MVDYRKTSVYTQRHRLDFPISKAKMENMKTCGVSGLGFTIHMGFMIFKRRIADHHVSSELSDTLKVVAMDTHAYLHNI